MCGSTHIKLLRDGNYRAQHGFVLSEMRRGRLMLSRLSSILRLIFGRPPDAPSGPFLLDLEKSPSMRLTSLACAAALAAAALSAVPAAAYEIDILTGKPLVVDGSAGGSRAMVNPIPREEVAYAGRGAPGSIIVNTTERRLYYILGNGKAIRYGVGVGRPGFTWGGSNRISRKAEWPDWTPPPQMLKRRPDLPRHMKGGEDNPLGARALYLGATLFRIHGSNEPETIGQAVSSGCFRMVNEDVIDLYNRVKVGAQVTVIR
jgi:lipoprotein-anchoring transpeptidase ErfK/SrfK